jgi:AcrR family transcriptional regulator
VARQLFTRNGLKNTTMNDIANASEKGRRTVYSYFRTKREIYEAVIEDESRQVRDLLRREVGLMDTPEQKLRRLMELRMDLAVSSGRRPEVWFRSLFSRDVDRADRMRNMVRGCIYEMIGGIISDGVADGVFDTEQAGRVKYLLTVLVQGCDWELMREPEQAQSEPPSRRVRFATSLDFIMDGLAVRKM